MRWNFECTLLNGKTGWVQGLCHVPGKQFIHNENNNGIVGTLAWFFTCVYFTIVTTLWISFHYQNRHNNFLVPLHNSIRALLTACSYESIQTAIIFISTVGTVRANSNSLPWTLIVTPFSWTVLIFWWNSISFVILSITCRATFRCTLYNFLCATLYKF